MLTPERTPTEIRDAGGELFEIQAWIALPMIAEKTAPSFSHHDANDLPVGRFAAVPDETEFIPLPDFVA